MKLPSVAAVKSTLHTAVSKPSLAMALPVLAGVAMLTSCCCWCYCFSRSAQRRNQILSRSRCYYREKRRQDRGQYRGKSGG